VGRAGPPAPEQVHAERRHGLGLSEQRPAARVAGGGRSGRRGAAGAEAAERVRDGNGEHQGTGEGGHVEKVRPTLGTGERQREVH